jgi:predicted PurR-regulated permease PerM
MESTSRASTIAKATVVTIPPVVPATGRVTTTAVTIAAMFVVIAGMKLAQPLLAPLLLAALITATVAPIAAWLSARGAPAAVGAGIALLVGLAFMAIFGVLISYSANEARAQLPAYWSSAQEGATALADRLTRLGFPASRDGLLSALDPGRLMGMLGGTLAAVADVLSHVVVMPLLVFFALAEIAGFGDKLRCMLPATSTGLQRVDAAVREVQKYLIVKTATSLLAAVAIGLWLTLFKIDFAVLLALLVFVLHYIPNLGTAIATVPGVAVALLQYGPGTALVIGAGYLVVNGVVGNVLEPKVMGRTLGLSALVVLLAMVFWGWLWGPIGALLSVPLTMIAKIAFENSPELRWISVLLGPTEHCPEVTGRPRAIPLVRPGAPVGLGAGRATLPPGEVGRA